MNTVLAELGKKFAERWATLLFLPGLLYVATFAVALVLRQRLRYGTKPLTEHMESIGRDLDGRPASQVLLLVGILLAATAAGLVAQFIGTQVERIWTGRWHPGMPRKLGGKLAERRAGKWDDAQRRFLQAQRETDPFAPPGVPHELAEVRNSIGLERPVLPTRIGDRLYAVQNRAWQHYGLDVAAAWPRLWLIVDDPSRQPLAVARRTFDAATLLTAWGVLYAALAVVWWPGAVIGAVVIVVGARRGLRAAALLGDLVEAVVDLHHRDLARAVGILGEDEPYSTFVGRRVTERLRKGT